MVMKRLRVVYFMVANTAILLLLIQVGTHLAIRTYEDVLPRLLSPGRSDAVMQNYEHMAPNDRNDLLRATEVVRFRYAAVVGFVHQAISSRFLNIDEFGIRSNSPKSPDIASMQGAIWFLGGSTAFGYGVADSETIPAQLERVTGRPVMNLGVSSYSSSEENLLLHHYLKIGYRPSLALFLDGINEACVTNEYEREMRFLFDRAQRDYAWDVGGPVAYAYGRLSRRVKRMMGAEVDDPDSDQLTCIQDGKRNELRTLHERTLAERTALCRLYDIECQTWVQPFAGLHGRRDAFATTFLEGYAVRLRELFEHLEPNWRAAGALFLTDVLDHYNRHAFIDEVHYSADASRVIAEAIAARLVSAENR